MDRRIVGQHRLLGAVAMAACLLAPAAATAAGKIRIVGSSTVYPFSTAVAEQFSRTYAGKFSAPIVESTGTGGGIKLFCDKKPDNRPDIANASRRIKSGEVKMCAASGITKIIEMKVGLDGLAVAHAKNAPNFNLTTRDLYMALAANPFGRGPNKARTWKDVNPALPADKIEVLGPPPTSGTRDSFNELIIEAGCNTDPAMAALKKSDEAKHKTLCLKLREDGPFIEAGENDNLIVQKLSNNPKMVGVFGFSYLEENGDRLKGVNLNGVAPTTATVQSGKYPGSRPLYIYVNQHQMAATPGVREFLVEFAKESAWGPRGYLVRKGLIPMPQPERTRYAAVASKLTLLNPASVK